MAWNEMKLDSVKRLIEEKWYNLAHIEEEN